jgi:RHS repeat-associated protein
VSYTYDQLNRLVQSPSNVTGTVPFAYDGFGNLTQQGQTSLSVDPATNRINSAGYQYNANGNVTQTPGPVSYTYDVANRLVSNGAIYNPRNQRVFDGTYIYLYTPEGKLAGKYTANWSSNGSQAFIQGQPSVYFAGKLIQEQGQWVMTDRLGSVRLNATNGRSSYQPYGAEVTPTTSDQRTKFATYYRDSAGLDYAGQRYYSNVTGRFLTPDPSLVNVDLEDPGSWNRYAYVQGDPVNSNDPTGQYRLICEAYPFTPGCPGWDSAGAAYGNPVGGSNLAIQEGPAHGGTNVNYGGGPASAINISNFSTTSPKAIGVQNSLRWIGAWLSQGNDPDCDSWLANNGLAIDTILGQTAANSKMYVGVGDFSDPTISAIAGVGGTNLPPDTALLTVNLGGAYFSSGYSVSGTGFTYQGGTGLAEVFILLHELGHLTAFSHRGAEDARSQANCSGAIARFCENKKIMVS